MDRTRSETFRIFMARVARVFWPIVRQVIGWIFLALAVLGAVLPVLPGILFLVIGIVLVGRRNIVIRRARVALKRGLRHWAAQPHPLVGRVGRVALRAQRETSRQARHLHRRYDAWARRRFRREPVKPPEGSPDARFDCSPKRVKILE
jgi:hypothetical protein